MGFLGAGLEALWHYPRLGAKSHYQNRRNIIPYKAYIYIEIYYNQNKPIHCNSLLEGSILTPIQHTNQKLNRKED